MSYVFVATEGHQVAVTGDAKGANLPAPKQGSWVFSKLLDDIALDPRIDDAAIEKMKIDGFWISLG